MKISVDGAELHYSTLGSGSPCMVLSAIGTKPYIRMTSAALSSRQTLVYVDLRGGGRSTGSAADLTFDVLAADLEAVRGELGAERVAVLGHSVLGILAIEYARRCPLAVSHESEFRPELLTHVMGTLVDGWDIRSGADSLRVPLLIAHGRYDYTVPYTLWEGMADTLPRTTMRLFGSSGHQPFLEEPEAFGAAVADWMAGEGKGAGGQGGEARRTKRVVSEP
jgi:pimeloyl-ACP methyl ester carboxylesterase